MTAPPSKVQALGGPALFVLLWSTGFVGAKYGLPYAPPFTFLAVRLAVAAQERAGVDVVTDGEQRRDNYSSFVGGRLDNCQLIPVTDLLPYADDPAHFAEELKALDVPAE